MVVLPSITTDINPNSESDITKLIHRQTKDTGFRDFTVTLAVKSGHVEWMKGEATSPVNISTNTVYFICRVLSPLQSLLLNGY